MKMYRLCMVLCVCMVSVVQAQVFTLDLPNNPLDPGFNHQVGLNMNLQSGNTQSNDISGSYRMDYVLPKSRTTVEFSYENASQSGSVYTDTGQASVRYIQKINSSYEWEGVLLQSYNRLQQINSRTDLGAGLRFNLAGVQDSTVSPNVMYGLGMLGESQTLASSQNQTEIRLVNYVSWLWNVTPTITCSSTIRSLLNTGNFGDHRADLNTSLSFAVTSQISLTMTLALNYNSVPAPGVQVLDTQWTNGITWGF